MRLSRLVLGAGALAAFASGSYAQTQTTPPLHGLAVHLDVRRARLDNGLRVVLAPDHTSPTIAVDVVYDVGARNEERGHSGFAHLFEHVMFRDRPTSRAASTSSS